MLPSGPPLSLFEARTVAQVSRDQVDVFGDLFLGFLTLGTLVGVVVISYIVYNALKYRDDSPDAEGKYDVEEIDPAEDDAGVARPQLGEIPTGTGKAGGKKLFVSFGISAVIVLSLITFAYVNLLHVEGTADDADALDIGVEANQYSYTYTYPSGETSGTLVVPEDRVVALNVTSCHPGECGDPAEGGPVNVMHTWSSPDLRGSTDAIPGRYTQTWFQASDPGTYRVECRELCGPQHSTMHFDEGIEVLPDDEFEDWCLENGCMAEDELGDWLDRTRGEN